MKTSGDKPRRQNPPIQIDKTPVQVRGEPLDPILWRGRQWAVTVFGIEALDGTYTIGKERLGEEVERWSWVSQMGAKNWVDLDDFATAWLVAIAIYGSRATPAQVRDVLAFHDLNRATGGRFRESA